MFVLFAHLKSIEQFVKKLSMLGVVTMKTLQALQISFVITAFQIDTNTDTGLQF